MGGGRAVIRSGGEQFTGGAVGERSAAANLFMLSVRYDDPYEGETEIAIRKSPEAAPAEYWMGIVRYRDLPDGERVIDGIEGFRRADCAIAR